MKQMKSGIRAVKWHEWSKFKKTVIRNLSDDPQYSQSNFFVRFLMFIWFRIKAENYVYVKESEIAGVLSLGTNRGDQVFIYVIAVESTFRKQGIGKALMDFSEERAVELQKSFMALVVMSSNIPAISLYQKYGYKRVGEGITYLSIPADKIQLNKQYSLELRKFNINNGDLKTILDEFFSGEIEVVSGKEGLEYFEQISFQDYYSAIRNSIQKGRRFMYLIYNEEVMVGFLLFSDKKHKRNVSAYSQVNTWNIDFLNNLAYVLKEIPSSTGKINSIVFRLSISKVERIVFEQTDFIVDASKNKLLMFKKL